jgi:two-component system, chemotaxis family, sensor kinase CheA
MPGEASIRGLGVRGKLIALLVGTAFVALLLACGSFVYYDRVTYTATKLRTLVILADAVSNSAFGPTAFQDAESSAVILKMFAAEPSAQVAAIYTGDGQRLSIWQRPGTRTSLPKQAPAAQPNGFSNDLLKLTSQIAQAGQPPVGTLRVLFSTDDIRARTRSFLQIASSVLLFSVLLAAFVASLAQKVLTRPVSILALAATSVQERQDFNIRAERVSNDELGRLTDAFNAMLAMIQARDLELTSHRAHLEHLVADRTRDLDDRNQEMRLVLDNVDQGFVTLDREDRIGAERSAAFDVWFGKPEDEAKFCAHLGSRVPGFEATFEMYWSQLIEGTLPLDLNLAQMPVRIHTEDNRHYELGYRPIHVREDQFDKLLVIVTDVTARVEKERTDADQAQTMAMFENITNDRGGFTEFLEEADQIVSRLMIEEARDSQLVLRELHTLKGNFGLFQLVPLARLVHHIESECIDAGELMTAAQRTELRAAWTQFATKANGFLGHHPNTLTVEQHELEAICDAIRARRASDELIRMVARLTDEPVAPKLARIGERARALARRLGKGNIEVVVRASGVRASHDFTWLWHVLPHVVNNSVDHGLHDAEERLERGLPTAKLELSATERGGQLVVEVRDDGRGIDWERVRKRAEGLGLRSANDNDLSDALFAQGLTTRDQVSEVSGRGVGLAAVKEACLEHGARIQVESRLGAGTLFRLTLATPENPKHSFRPSSRTG